MPTALPTNPYPSSHSWCSIELERKPVETFLARADELARVGRIYPMASFDCTHNPDTESPDKWLPEVFDEMRRVLSAVPAQMRVIRPEGVQCEPDPTRAFAQQLKLREWCESAGLFPVHLFVDSEKEYTGAFTRRDFWRSACGPMACPIVMWNHVDPHPAIPCEYWAGKFMGATLSGVSNPETYVGWHNPEDPNVAAGNPGANESKDMWLSFIRCINAIRSCLRSGKCIPHLPVVHPDPAIARWYTAEVVIHARLAGCTTFQWAQYMSDEKSLMADTIAQTMTDADAMATDPSRGKYYSSAILSTARVVTTRQYKTTRKVF